MENPVDELNPYKTSSLGSSTTSSPAPLSLWRIVVVNGVLLSIASTFPLAGLIALFIRFPIPLGGYLSGPRAVMPAMIAVLFYGGLMGGFVVVGIGGGLAGILACSISSNATRRLRLTRFLSVAVTFFLLRLLVDNLDWYISFWN